MNILVCTSSDSSFNSIRPELEIYISMARAGHNITLITHRNKEYRERFKRYGIDVIEQPITKKISFNSIRLIRKTVQDKSIDIVYATNSKSIPNCAFACIGLPVKLVVYRGTASGLYWQDPSNYLGVLHPRVDGIVCVSDYVNRYVSSKHSLRNKHITTIHKGHDLKWYVKKPADLGEFGIGPDDFTAICVTNARPHKGLHIMLQAAAQLADIESLHLLLVGRGIDKAPYTNQIRESGMQSRIHLTGYRNDAPELIAASSVLIQPSISGEGLPRVILESLAYGTPVISSSNPGSMEIITDGFNGQSVPIGDPKALAESIRKLQQSPETLAELSRNSKHILETTISHKLTVEKYIEYFNLLLEH